VLSNTVSSAIAAAYFAHFGLSIPEWRVMAVLASNPGLSAAEVTARTAMDKVAVSRAVAALLAAGRLRRTTAVADRRRTHLHLTSAGARVYAQVVPMALEYERGLLASLSKQDRATLDRLLRVLLGRAVELGPAHAE
jgi:DNA-binding MarR family transcriptional regulator